MDSIKKTCEHCINNYFLLSALAGFFQMLAIPKANVFIFVVFSSIYISYFSIKKYFTPIAWGILSIIMVIIVSSLLNSYPLQLLGNGIYSELLPMLFFFVGRHPLFSNNKIFDKALLPFLVVCLCGLYLFFFQPNWYVSYRLNKHEFIMNDEHVFEMTRLSAFWEYPYWVSYGASIIIYYLFCKFRQIRKIEIKWKAYIVFLFVILLLAQQRGPMIFVAFSIILIMLLPRETVKSSINSFFLQLFLILSIVVVAIFSIIPDDLFSFIIDRYYVMFDDSSDNFIETRANIFSEFYKKNITLFGDGLGAYSHSAGFLTGISITDQMYLKMLYETGIFGLSSRIILIIVVLCHGLKNVNKNLFEIGVVIMFLFTMFGANSLASYQMHNSIFWLCCGRIYNSNKKIYEKKSNRNSSSTVLSIPGE